MSVPLTIFATGDVFSDLADNTAAFRHLSPLFAMADIVFGNCEGVYTDHPDLAPSAMQVHSAPTERGRGLAAVPFHVLGFANNHTLDAGRAGLRETLALLRGQGIATVGAGEEIEEALRPAIIERQGRKAAFLAFCSTFPVGYEAREGRPGLAPLRVDTLYRSPVVNFLDPGIEPEILTIPQVGDLARFRAAIADTRKAADVVVVACHWGTVGIFRERLVPLSSTHRRRWCDGVQAYERQLAADAIDHGADAVVCHHQIGLRGVGFHRGRPIFHGLGVLVNHFQHGLPTLVGEAEEGFPLYPFEPAYRRTGVAVLEVDEDGSVAAGFAPAQILADGSTEPLRPDDERATAIADRLAELNAAAGFETVLERGERGGWAFFRLRPERQDEQPVRQR